MSVAAAAAGLAWREVKHEELALAAQQRTITQLDGRIASLEGSSRAATDWPKVAARVEASVVIVETGGGLGSGWVVSSGPAGSDLVTNFHVVADAWSSGSPNVDVRAGDQTVAGVVVKVDLGDDLAIVHVADRLPALTTAAGRPALGEAVMAVGAPLGLSNSVSIGLVSGFRSLGGSDYMQFSAAISPGNSGGPVVDGHGVVVAVASAKFEGTGVEGISLAIPVQTVCTNVAICSTAALP